MDRVGEASMVDESHNRLGTPLLKERGTGCQAIIPNKDGRLREIRIDLLSQLLDLNLVVLDLVLGHVIVDSLARPWSSVSAKVLELLPRVRTISPALWLGWEEETGRDSCRGDSASPWQEFRIPGTAELPIPWLQQGPLSDVNWMSVRYGRCTHGWKPATICRADIWSNIGCDREFRSTETPAGRRCRRDDRSTQDDSAGGKGGDGTRHLGSQADASRLECCVGHLGCLWG